MILTLPEKMRLKRRRDFRAAFAQRCRVADHNLIIYIAGNGLEISRLGLSVSRRLGKAVVRNRTKRLIREAFRLQNLGREVPGYDIVCIPTRTKDQSVTRYERSLRRLIEAGVRKLGDRR